MSKRLEPNKLIHEKSPYLLQHAYNPVDWFAWGAEAFSKAAAESKPIFLSIGYSTCHWCHVMEEESFSNERIAAILNESFVPIKVDREERPDIDHVYMEAVMAMTGSGGWPLNIFLTPEKRPFYGGTYFPPAPLHNRPSFEQVLLQLAYQWSTDRERVLQASHSIVQALGDFNQEKSKGSAVLDEGVLDKAAKDLSQRFDSVYGGFGGAPKFPTPHLLSFLLYYHVRTGDKNSLEMVLKTLDGMRKGGIFDHVGGGAHRYSTDERWHVPHFEKMLYDQALLARLYLEAYQVTRNKVYADVARQIFDYVIQKLSHPEGAFFSAEDADSALDFALPEHKKEGAFYSWSAAELADVLTPEENMLWRKIYGVKDNGNVRHDPTGEFSGLNVFYVACTAEEIGLEMGLSCEEVEQLLASAKAKIFAAREKRPKPHLDDKILTDWNGLMIAAFAYGSRVLEDKTLAGHAERAARFVMKQMSKEGLLLHSWRQGRAEINGFLDDYAFFTYGLIELYEATFNPDFLKAAREFVIAMIEKFTDLQGGGFYFKANGEEELFLKTKQLYDGAVPSGNSVALFSLARIAKIFMDREMENKMQMALQSFSHEISTRPSLYPFCLAALDFSLGPVRELIINGSLEDANTHEYLKMINSHLAIRQIVLLNDASLTSSGLISWIRPVAMNSQSTVSYCENYTCREPLKSPEALKAILDSGLNKRTSA